MAPHSLTRLFHLARWLSACPKPFLHSTDHEATQMCYGFTSTHPHKPVLVGSLYDCYFFVCQFNIGLDITFIEISSMIFPSLLHVG